MSDTSDNTFFMLSRVQSADWLFAPQKRQARDVKQINSAIVFSKRNQSGNERFYGHSLPDMGKSDKLL